MRTPLNVIISTINLLKLKIVNDQYEKDYFLENMDYMINNSNRLLRSVNNYIDIARIDSNVIDISFTMENLVEVIDEVVDVTADYIKGSNVKLFLIQSLMRLLVLLIISSMLNLKELKKRILIGKKKYNLCGFNYMTLFQIQLVICTLKMRRLERIHEQLKIQQHQQLIS